MKIVCTSDFHGHLPSIPECDLLLIAGDVVPRHITDQEQFDWLRSHFRPWLNLVPADEIVWVAGNHDTALAYARPYKIADLGGTYLNNNGVEIDNFKIWGSPFSPTFGNWPFMEDDPFLWDFWQEIPDDTDILLVHGPPHGFGDLTTGWHGSPPENVGSRSLRNRMVDLNLKLTVCGHIHPAYGIYESRMGTIVNGSYVNPSYEPANVPIVIEL